MQLLRVQSERLAQEEIWCHPTATVEVGGLLIATPNAHRILENEAAWQVVIFIIRHDEDGTIGVVLNRPTALTMGPQSDGGIPLDVEGLSDSARNCFSNLRIYMGGPQAQTAIHVLHMHGYLGEDTSLPGPRAPVPSPLRCAAVLHVLQ